MICKFLQVTVRTYELDVNSPTWHVTQWHYTNLFWSTDDGRPQMVVHSHHCWVTYTKFLFAKWQQQSAIACFGWGSKPKSPLLLGRKTAI